MERFYSTTTKIVDCMSTLIDAENAVAGQEPRQIAATVRGHLEEIRDGRARKDAYVVQLSSM